MKDLSLAKIAQYAFKGSKSTLSQEELTEQEESQVNEIKSQINQAYNLGRYDVMNELISNNANIYKKAAFDQLNSYTAGLMKIDGEAILSKKKLEDFKVSEILTTEEKNNIAQQLGTNFIDIAEELLSKQDGYVPYESIPITTETLEEIYKDAKTKLPNSKELDNAYLLVKKGLTKLKTLDPNANLTEADLNDLGLKMDLKFYKAKKFNEFLQNKPLLGGDLNDDNEGIGKQVLSFAIENFRSSPQKFSSQPKMLHQVIELIKEQNHDNPKVLSQLAQELVRVSNKANWPLAILDLDLEIKKLEKLGAKIENYNYGSLSEAERKHFLNMAHIICKTDSNPNIKGNVANVINLSAENLPTEAEMVSVHKSIQALEPRIGRIPASAFLISSLKEITEAYIKTQIHSHGEFRKANNVMEVAQNSPSHRLSSDREEGVNELRDFTIKEITKAGEPILENPTEDTPKHFLDFLQRGPLFSSNLNHDFTEKTLQFGIYMAIDQPEILDKTIKLFKEQYKDNDQALEDLTNKLIEYSNLFSEDQLEQKALNTKIIEHLGPLLSADHIDINKIIAQAAKNKNISLVSALILNNSSSNIEPNLAALKLMHDTGDIAAEKLLQRPEEAIDYLRSSDSLDDNLFKLILSKIPSKLAKDEIITLLKCSNSIKSSSRRNEINQRIEKDLSSFVADANDRDFMTYIQSATYDENPQLLSSIILHSDGRKITTVTFELIKSLQLLHKEGYLDATAKMLEDPEQALLFIQESMNKTTKEYNPVSNELFDIIVTTLITNTKFNASMADQLVESIDKADQAQKRVIYDAIQKNSVRFLEVVKDIQVLFDKALKDKEVDLLSEIINHVSLTDIKVDLEALKMLYSNGQTTAVEKLLNHPDRATKYLNNAINKDIDPGLFGQIIKAVTKKIDQKIDYETREVDSPSITLVNCSNKATNPAQRKAINAEIKIFFEEVPKYSSEDEDLVPEATAAKNGELLSILIKKNIIWSTNVSIDTLEVLHNGKHTEAIDKLLEDKELAAGLLLKAAQAEKFNQELVALLIPQTIKDKELGKLLLDALLPKLTNAEQLNQIIDSQSNKDNALKAVANNNVSIALLSPKNIIALTSLMVHEGIDPVKNEDFPQILTRMMDLTYAGENPKPGVKPSKLITESELRTKLSNSLFPKETNRAEALCANPEFIQAVKSYYKERKNQEQKPIWTALKHWANNIKRESLSKRDLQQYKFEKIVDKVEKIQAALTKICPPTLELQPKQPSQKITIDYLSKELKQKATEAANPIIVTDSSSKNVTHNNSTPNKSNYRIVN